MRAAVAVLVACAAGVFPAWSQQRAQPEIRISGGPYHLPPPLITTQSDLVTLDVVVHKPDGTLIGGLKRDNFVVLDNGEPRPLSQFSIETAPARPLATAPAPLGVANAARPGAIAAAPRSIALYFDDVNTETGDLENARNAAERFVREALTPGDRVAVFTASSEQGLAFTHDSSKLLDTIDAVRTHPRQSRTMLPCPQITAYQAYLIAEVHEQTALQAAGEEYLHCPGSQPPVDDLNGKPLSLGGQNNLLEEVLAQAEATWDQARGNSEDTLQALRGVVDDLAQQPGSRMLLMTSAGFLSETLEEQQDDIIRDALHAGVVINALDAKGLYTDGPGRPLDQVDSNAVGTLPLLTYFFEETSKFPMRQAQDAAMVNLAQSTGGLFFHDNNDLTLGFYRLGMVPEITYQLAFSPGDIPHDGKFHKLAVEVTPAQKVIVQARPGYYAPAPTASVADLRQRMDAAMRGDDNLAGVPATIVSAPGKGSETVEVRLSVDRMPFHDKGRRFQDLYFIAGLFNSQGKFVTGKQGEMDLALMPATWRRLESEGLNAKLTLPAPAGDYRLRVVVGEFSDGALSATDRAVEIH